MARTKASLKLGKYSGHRDDASSCNSSLSDAEEEQDAGGGREEEEEMDEMEEEDLDLIAKTESSDDDEEAREDDDQGREDEEAFRQEEGFSTWTKKDFNAFIKACEKYGRDDIKSIASEMDGKTEEEVERSAKVFKERYKELNDYYRIIENLEKGEAINARKDEIMRAIGKKLDQYKNPWWELEIQYGQDEENFYSEECDRFMLCMVYKLGYGNWEELKAAYRNSPLFRFDWFIKSRTPQELARRCDTLIQLIEKENEEYDDQEKEARKDKRLKNLTTSKQSTSKTPATEAPTLILSKRRKQTAMDDYLSSGQKRRQSPSFALIS